MRKKQKKPSFKIKGSIELYLLAGIVTLGVLMAGGLFFYNQTGINTTLNSCVDYNPPNTSITVTFNGVQYDLIKKNAGIIDSKVPEMTKIGHINAGDVYQANGSNYFGQKFDQNAIYVLVSASKGFHYFDIYYKDGVPLPDWIVNGNKIGGKITVLQGDQSTFPPFGFNTADIQGLSVSLVYPAFVANGVKDPASTVTSLPGVRRAGSLNTSKGLLALYDHFDTLYLIDGADAYEYLPSNTPLDTKSKGKNTLQLSVVNFVTTPLICWYTPECKPAVYVYTPTDEHVHVQVTPQGYFTYTSPVYPSGGWDGTAHPDGSITVNKTNYKYLYYESNLKKSAVIKPTHGFVVHYNQLTDLYNSLLPKLGLTRKEITDFTNYWGKTLPKSPYYFVGIMDNSSINSLEPMDISPKPDNIIRVRLYFKPLENFASVTAPVINQVNRPANGFTVAEWGGIVETDPNHPFICSQ